MKGMLLLIVVALAAGCVRPRTEIWLEVSSDLVVPPELNRVSITVSRHGPQAWPFTTSVMLGTAGATMPLTLGLVPDDEHDLSLYVRVVGFVGAKPVVTSAVETSFLAGQTRVLSIALPAACRGVTCDASQTCAPGGACVPDAVDPHALPRWGAAGENGADGAPPDATSTEAGALDGGPPDAMSPDAATPDAMSSDVSVPEAAAEAPSPVLRLVDGSDTSVNGAPTDTPPARYLCPDGDVVTGFDVDLNQGLIGSLQMVCARPQVARDAPFTVTLTPGLPAAAGRGLADRSASPHCSDGQVVVGYDGHSGLLLDQLAFRCAALVTNGATVGVSDAMDLTPVGGSGGSPLPRTDCGPGMVARGVIVSQDIWLMRIGLVCAGVELQ